MAQISLQRDAKCYLLLMLQYHAHVEPADAKNLRMRRITQCELNCQYMALVDRVIADIWHVRMLSFEPRDGAVVSYR
jgi:hypothetical protein